MIEHRSYGVVPVRQGEHGWEFLVVQHHTGNWAFPKGHQEPGESGDQTARRELAEETGIRQVDLHTPESFDEEYVWKRNGQKNHKVATYYLGLVTDDEPLAIQREELDDGRWISADEVEEVLTFAESQAIFRNAWKYMHKKKLWM